MIKNFFYMAVILIGIKSYAQKDYYIIDEDTTRCSYLRYEVAGTGTLAKINYQDATGKFVTAEGKKNLIDISTMFTNGKTFDKIPQKAHKPDGHVKWAERIVDGKLVVNYYYNTVTFSGFNSSGQFSSASSSITKFFVKMPDGTFYDIRDSGDRKKHIIPYLKQCSAFVSAYNGDYDDEVKSFTKTVELYNSLCK